MHFVERLNKKVQILTTRTFSIDTAQRREWGLEIKTRDVARPGKSKNLYKSYNVFLL